MRRILVGLMVLGLSTSAMAQDVIGPTQRFINSQGWTEKWNGSYYEFEFTGDGSTWRCQAIPDNAQQQLVFKSISKDPIPSDEAVRLNMLEFVTRANYQLGYGTFSVDMVTGEFAFRTSADVSRGRLSEDMVRQLVTNNLSFFNRFLPAAKEVMYRGADPAAAVASALAL